MSDPRILALRDPSWISYTLAENHLASLAELLEQPRGGRMRNIALLGETNNGKTTLINQFIKKHNPPLDPNKDHVTRLIVKCDMPAVPDESRLYQSILASLNADGSPKETPDSKFRRLKMILARLGTRMLIIDETTNVSAIKGARLQGLLNAIKQLGNELEIAIVLAGLPEYMNVIAQNKQLANRFSPLLLPRWDDGASYASLLLAFEVTFGLKKPCDFRRKTVVTAVHSSCEGLIGETGELLRRLARRAIENGSECILLSDLQPESLKSLGWIRPSNRARLSGM